MTIASFIRRHADGLFLSPSADASPKPEDFGLHAMYGTLCGASGKTSAEVMVLENRSLPRRGSVIYCWGGSGSMRSHIPDMLFFTGMGFKVLTYDPVGFGTLSGTPTLRSFTDNSAEAAESLITCQAEGEKIILFADSVSAVPALIAAREKRRRLALLILQNGFAGFGSCLRARFGALLGPAAHALITPGLEDPADTLTELSDLPVLLTTADAKRAFKSETDILTALPGREIRHFDLTNGDEVVRRQFKEEILRYTVSDTEA
jgi:pimeloyl-ACP methyl ester carboxylesterase